MVATRFQAKLGDTSLKGLPGGSLFGDATGLAKMRVESHLLLSQRGTETDFGSYFSRKPRSQGVTVRMASMMDSPTRGAVR
jgi:hypothetical protein